MNVLKSVVIFGYGKFGNSIANSIQQEQNTDLLVAVNSDEELELAQMDGLKVVKFNVESDSSIKNLGIKDDAHLICAMDNNHENLFLALTLRGIYKKNYIISISDSIHLTDKLRMAGVNRVIDIYQISGNMIKNILEIPIATKFLQGFINREHDYIFKEIIVKKGSKLNGKLLSEIDFDKYRIIFIGMIDKEMGNQFIFSTVGLDHHVDTGDILVCIGKESDLERFIQECGGKD